MATRISTPNPFRYISRHQLEVIRLALMSLADARVATLKLAEAAVVANQVQQELDSRKQDEQEAAAYRAELMKSLDQMRVAG